jgi:hypothetical protein
MREVVFADPINRFPDCVFIKLEGDFNSLSSSTKSKQAIFGTKKEEFRKKAYDAFFDLKLTIRFGGEKIKVPFGNIWFGLKRGELRLKLVNGLIPIETQGLTFPLENQKTSEIQKENTKEIEASISSAIPCFGTKARDATKISSKTGFNAYLVSTIGTECEPVWIFENITEHPILKGQLNSAALGLVNLSSKSYAIIATFEVRGQQDISLIEADGFWAQDIGRNKLAVLERYLFLKHIAPMLNPYLSFTEVCHG